MPFSWSLKLQKYQNIIILVFILALWQGWLDGIMNLAEKGMIVLALKFAGLFGMVF